MPFPEPGMQNPEPETWGMHKSLAGVGVCVWVFDSFPGTILSKEEGNREILS